MFMRQIVCVANIQQIHKPDQIVSSCNDQLNDDNFYKDYLHMMVITAGHRKNKLMKSCTTLIISPGFWQRNFLEFEDQKFGTSKLRLTQTSNSISQTQKPVRCWNSSKANGLVPVLFIHKRLFQTHTRICIHNGSLWKSPVAYDVKYSERSWTLSLTTSWAWSGDKLHWNVLDEPKI